MKIAVDAREIKTGYFTGMRRFLTNFLDQLDEEKRKKIVLLADQYTDIDKYSKSFSLLKAFSPLNFWFDQITIPQMIKKSQADVYFSPNFKTSFIASSKKVITIHDLYFLKDILRTGTEQLKPYISYLRASTKAAADKIITVSEFSKQEIVEMLNLQEVKVKVIYNGIEKRFQIVDGSLIRVIQERYKIDAPYFLYVGNFYPHKNVSGLIRAYSMLSKEVFNSHKLVIIAQRDRRFAKIRPLLKKLRLENKVILLDSVPEDILVLFYNFSAAFIFPSFYEGFGLPPLEAMASGAPVIAAKAACLPEVLGEAALYIDPKEPKTIAYAMNELVKDAHLRNELRAKGLLRAARYDPQDFSDKLLHEIETV